MHEVVLSGPRGLRLRCVVARTHRERVRGLRDPSVPEVAALLLPRATSVHTIGMRRSIRVVRLDAQLRVIDVRVLAPGRFLGPRRRARHVLECPVGSDLRVGDRVRLETGERLG